MYRKEHASVNRPEKWTGGVDWFRWKINRVAAAPDAMARIRELQEQDKSRASSVKPWRFCGYEGLATDSIRWGQRGGNVLWESSGEKAASTLAFMRPSGGYCLRIDLQTTLRFSRALPGFGTSLLSSLLETSRSTGPSRIRAGVSTATDGLWLGTVGRRTSPSYIRVYDKGVESKLDPQGMLWRIELEAKLSHAKQLCQDHLTSLPNPSFCASYVASSLTRLGLPSLSSALASSPVDVNLGRKSESTAGTLAVWLSQTVKPTIPRLLTVFSVAEVLEMLGLSDVAVPIGKGNVPPKST